MARQPKRICRTRIVLSSIETGWAGSPGPKEVNRATEGGCPGSLAFGDPGDREPQPDHSRISDVPVVSPANRLQCRFRVGEVSATNPSEPGECLPTVSMRASPPLRSTHFIPGSDSQLRVL